MQIVNTRLIAWTELLSLLVISFGWAGVPSGSSKMQQLKSKSPGRVLFSIPVGGEGVHYKGVGLKEVETWGPDSLRIAPDGTFLITDTVTNRVLLFKRGGRMLSALTLRDADGITDAVKNKDDLYVLDSAAPDPTIIRLNNSGWETKRFPVQPESRLRSSGLSVGESAALLELYGGTTVLGADDQPNRARSASSRNYAVTIPTQSSGLDGQSEGSIQLGRRTVATIRVKNTLGGLSVLAATPEGDFYVLVEEMISAPKIMLDQTVRHYNVDGTQIGMVRVPIAERVTDVSHGVAVGPDRQVYALITRPLRADVVQLEFAERLPDILPAQPVMALNHARRSRRTRCKISRAAIRAMADTYWQNKTFLSAANLNGQCDYRQKPSYLRGRAGNYNSVPYDWGGFDSVSAFNKFMTMPGGKYMAGDRKEKGESHNSVADCSRGVDCSGFVSRCWGLRYKASTVTLTDISTEIRVNDLQTGDILNKEEKHVVIFDKWGRPNGGPRDGVYTWEATQTNNLDRVVYKWWPWSRFAGYKPRRYNYVCP